jgi:putative transposase
MLLDSEAFLARLTLQLQDCATAEIPKRQRLEHRPSLQTLMAGTDSRPTRNEAMARAYLKHGYTLTEIGRAAGLH